MTIIKQYSMSTTYIFTVFYRYTRIIEYIRSSSLFGVLNRK